MNDTTHSLLASLWWGRSDLHLFWEIGLLLLLALLIWPLPGLLRQRLWRAESVPSLSERDWRRLVLPSLMLLAVFISREFAHWVWSATPLLDLALPLLVSMTLVQASFYVLRRAITANALLQSLEHLVSWSVWGVVALYITGHLNGLVQLMQSIGFQAGAQRISLYSASLGVLTVAAGLMFALWLARSLEVRFIERIPVSANLKTALSKAIKTLLVLVSVLVSLPVIGIDLTMLSVFGGAMGVGIGLGLQKIVSNYFAGFTLLLDQSILIGDMVTINGRSGEVGDIRTRYTVIRGRDKTETIIPNEAMVTSVVINHTPAGRESSVQLPVQVAYDSNLERARAIMLAAANGHARVTRQEGAQVRLMGFGENGINLELVCWTDATDNDLALLRSDINWAIWDGFRREGIEIPCPRRVVHLQATGASC